MLADVHAKPQGSIPTLLITNHQLSTMEAVIADRLEKSGHFQILNPSDFPELNSLRSPVYSDDPRYVSWRKTDVDYLVTIRGFSYLALSDYDKNRDKTEVQFQFIDLKQGQQLLGYDFFAKKEEYPSVGEFIAEAVYETITGRKSDFHYRPALVMSNNDTNDLMIAYADGRARAILNSPKAIGPIGFSPEGLRVVYQSFESGQGELYLQTLNTGKRQRLSIPAAQVESIVWSPDGEQIALTLLEGESNTSVIYIFNLDSQRLKRVIDGATSRSPVWSVDGSSLFHLTSGGNTTALLKSDLKNGDTSTLQRKLSPNLRIFSAPGHKVIYALEQDLVSIFMDSSGAVKRKPLFTDENIVGVPSVSPQGHLMMYSIAQDERQIVRTRALDTQSTWDYSRKGFSFSEPAWAYPEPPVEIALVNANERLPSAIDEHVLERLKRVAHKANNGDIPSARLMARLYENNRPQSYDPPDNPAVAFFFHSRAAAAGDSYAMNHLAKRYSEGNGVARDLEQAATFYRRHAQANESRHTSYKELVTVLMTLGDAKSLAEATQWMNKEMRGKSIPQSNSIVDAASQFRYLYEGGYEAEKLAAEARQRESELAKLIEQTGRDLLRYNDLIINFSKQDEVISQFRSWIYDHHYKGKLSRLAAKDIGQTTLSPQQGIEIICLRYRPLYSTRNIKDCYFFENDTFVGFKFDRSQVNCPYYCQWGNVELQDIDEKFDIAKGFVSTENETNEGTLRRKWRRKGLKLQTLEWGEFATKHYRKVGALNHLDRTSYGLQSTICLFPDHLEPLLLSLKAERGNYTCN